MEGEPQNEDIKQAERRIWLVQHLREKGPEDDEVKRTLLEWKAYQEAHESDAQEAHIYSQIELALLCKDAGLLEEAQEYLLNAWDSAHDQRNDELCRRIELEHANL